MRKLSTLFFVLLISAYTFGQSGQILKKVNLGINSQEYQMIDRSGVIEQAINVTNSGSTSTIPIGTTVTDAVTAVKIGEASNAYTFLLPDNNQISTVPDVGSMGGSMAFIYRQNIGQCGGPTADNGRLRYSISTDGGNSWNVGAASGGAGCYGLGPINPLYTQQSRYPNVTLFLPPGSTADTMNLEMVYSGPVLTAAGSGWDGSVLGLVADVTTTPVTNQEVYPFQAGNQYFNYSMIERVQGEFWYASFSWDGTNVGNDIILNKGVYDMTTNEITWSVATTISPNYSLTFDGAPNRTGSLNIAFSPDGTTGHVAILADLVGNQDSVFAPCWASSTDGGATWGTMQEFDFTQYNNFGLLTAMGNGFIDIDTTTMDTVSISTAPTTAFDFGMTVDKLGNPHIVTVIGLGNVSNSDGTYSDPGYTINGAVGYNIFDFTPDQFGDMNMLFISDQATLRGNFGDQVAGGSETTTADPWMQASRSPAGDKVFFSWTETDTTGVGSTDNSNPDLWVGGYDVDNNMIIAPVNFTGNDANFASRAIMPKIAPISLYDKSSTHTIPTVVMDIGAPGTTLLNSVSFFYFSDVTVDNSDFNIPGEFFFNCKQNPITGNLTEAKPDCGASDGSLVVTNLAGGTPGAGGYTFEWSANAAGATTATAANLMAGIYSVTVVDSVGCSSTFEAVLNNANAPSLAINTFANITCNGAGDGTATVTATGGAGGNTYSWDNGEITATAVALAAGPHTVTVTDMNGCISFISVSITEPQGVSLTASATGVDCFGDVTGTATAAAFGGSGTLTYSWSSGETTPAIANIGGGSYTIYVTDANNCTDSADVVVDEPAEISVAFQANGNANAMAPFNGNVTATPAGGTAPFVVDWVGPFQGPVIDPATDTLKFTSNNSQFIFGLYCGEYVATITDANGCVFMDTVMVESINEACNVAIDELISGINSMNIIPNPNNGSFTVSMELQNRDNVSMELIDLNGRTIAARSIKNISFHEENFNLTNLSAGIYLLKVKTSFGFASRKLVIR